MHFAPPSCPRQARGLTHIRSRRRRAPLAAGRARLAPPIVIGLLRDTIGRPGDCELRNHHKVLRILWKTQRHRMHSDGPNALCSRCKLVRSLAASQCVTAVWVPYSIWSSPHSFPRRFDRSIDSNLKILSSVHPALPPERHNNLLESSSGCYRLRRNW